MTHPLARLLPGGDFPDRPLAGAAEEAGTGAKLGGALGSALEAVPPPFGQALHAAALVLGAVIGAISGAARDTFGDLHPGIAAAWLTKLRLDPHFLFSGIDNVGTEDGARNLVRWFRLLDGEVTKGKYGNDGNVCNPTADCGNPYLRPATALGGRGDPDEPLTDPALVRQVHQSWAKTVGRADGLPLAPRPYMTPAYARALLATVRANPGPMAEVEQWSQSQSAQARESMRRHVADARRVAGETGPGDQVLTGLYGDVSVPNPAEARGRAADRPLGAAPEAAPAGPVVVQVPAPPSRLAWFAGGALVAVATLAGLGLRAARRAGPEGRARELARALDAYAGAATPPSVPDDRLLADVQDAALRFNVAARDLQTPHGLRAAERVVQQLAAIPAAERGRGERARWSPRSIRRWAAEWRAWRAGGAS